MKNGKFFSILALVVSLLGLAVGLIALLKRKNRKFSDELDFDDSIYLEDNDYDYSEADGEDFSEDEEETNVILDETIADDKNDGKNP